MSVVCCLSCVNLGGGVNDTQITHKTSSECSINLQTEACFIFCQIKAAEVERVEKIMPGNQGKTS